ncbi:MAG: hypothetical protein COB40_12375 [Marinosulfonomonas sp.]|nr:MAG: hypothetical protein COB40_12375 [Marinosulfonomonas sp.]
MTRAGDHENSGCGKCRASGGSADAGLARIGAQISAGQPSGGDLARAVGIRGYHGAAFTDGIYPVE